MSIEDKVYDVTAFLDKHPGGREYLMLAAGRDNTDLFASYHPFTSAPRSMLAQYEIGRVATRQYPKFRPDSGFYSTLCKRVDAYFKANKIDSKAAFPSIWRMTFAMTVHVTAYLLLFSAFFERVFPTVASAGLAWWGLKLLAATLLGWSLDLGLLHAMHDCSHSSVGHNESIWKYYGRFFSEAYAGSSMVSWHNQHVVGHHIYTNVYSVDPDLPVAASGDIRLIAPQQNWSFLYRFQHLYLIPLYSLLTFKARAQDYDIHTSRKNGPITVNPITPSQWVRFYVSKLVWLALRVPLPLALGCPLGQCLLFNLVAELFAGAYLAINFQVSHVSDECEFPVTDDIPSSRDFTTSAEVKAFAQGPKPASSSSASASAAGALDKANKAAAGADVNAYHGFVSKELAADLSKSDAAALERKAGVTPTKMWDIEWAKLQVRTSVDYHHESPLMTFLCGALNYQTEHHLFPSVSQYCYPLIAPIVQQTCKEFGVQYNYIPTFWAAFKGHVAHLRRMGHEGRPHHAHLA